MAMYEMTEEGPRHFEDLRNPTTIGDEQRLIMERLRFLQMQWEQQTHDLWTRYLTNNAQLNLLNILRSTRPAPSSRPLTDREQGRMRIISGQGRDV